MVEKIGIDAGKVWTKLDKKGETLQQSRMFSVVLQLICACKLQLFDKLQFFSFCMKLKFPFTPSEQRGIII